MASTDHFQETVEPRDENWDGSCMVEENKNLKHMVSRLNWTLCPAWSFSISLWNGKEKETHSHIQLYPDAAKGSWWEPIIHHYKLWQKLKPQTQADLAHNTTHQGERQGMATVWDGDLEYSSAVNEPHPTRFLICRDCPGEMVSNFFQVCRQQQQDGGSQTFVRIPSTRSRKLMSGWWGESRLKLSWAPPTGQHLPTGECDSQIST